MTIQQILSLYKTDLEKLTSFKKQTFEVWFPSGRDFEGFDLAGFQLFAITQL
jgi:hypothetical protein